ncbi:PREDICTED: uncharacterized protein LOC107328345 [Acropora digitifera]|uniref:uncharacterized protein LOC107328345 n=1 Tax=Acropora digitifera TaxID=70779 RepID=UPI00077B13FC|nr:PREDICTED: uncharacterized protein LOC107328345 [Acropora digitifera]
MLHIRNGKRLASYVLILQLISYLTGLQAWTYRYEFVDDEIKVDEVEEHCAQRSGAIINDMETLQNAINALKQNPNNDSYWTGLSWHSRRNGFFWYRNFTLNTSVAESLVERPDSWICFVVRRNTKRVIPEYCDTLHHFLCENANDGHPPSVTTFPDRKCNASELQNRCKMLSGNKMTGVKFKDVQDLKNKTAKANLRGDEKYWTALSWHSEHKFCWNQDANHPANVSRNVHWWFCFILRNEKPHLVAERCSTKHKYICELREGQGAISSQNITKEQQNLATGMKLSSSSLSSSSSYSSSLSSLLWSSSSLSTTNTKINAPAQLSKTSKTSTVNLSNGFTAPQQVLKIQNWLWESPRSNRILQLPWLRLYHHHQHCPYVRRHYRHH